jgi:hypothetical protein
MRSRARAADSALPGAGRPRGRRPETPTRPRRRQAGDECSRAFRSQCQGSRAGVARPGFGSAGAHRVSGYARPFDCGSPGLGTECPISRASCVIADQELSPITRQVLERVKPRIGQRASRRQQRFERRQIRGALRRNPCDTLVRPLFAHTRQPSRSTLTSPPGILRAAANDSRDHGQPGCRDHAI